MRRSVSEGPGDGLNDERRDDAPPPHVSRGSWLSSPLPFGRVVEGNPSLEMEGHPSGHQSEGGRWERHRCGFSPPCNPETSVSHRAAPSLWSFWTFLDLPSTCPHHFSCSSSSPPSLTALDACSAVYRCSRKISPIICTTFPLCPTPRRSLGGLWDLRQQVSFGGLGLGFVHPHALFHAPF